MSETITLAHVSDVHLSPLIGFTPRTWNAKRGLGFFNWQRKRRYVHQRSVVDSLIADALSLNVDHFAITGDLINLGLPSEYDGALAWLNSATLFLAAWYMADQLQNEYLTAGEASATHQRAWARDPQGAGALALVWASLGVFNAVSAAVTQKIRGPSGVAARLAT